MSYIIYHVISYHHVVSYHIPCHIIYHVISYIISYTISYHIISYTMSYHIISYTMSYHISYHIPCHIISYHIPCHISYTMSYHIIYHIMVTRDLKGVPSRSTPRLGIATCLATRRGVVIPHRAAFVQPPPASRRTSQTCHVVSVMSYHIPCHIIS